MNLVQKLPIGLSLACLMMMSSCSKEDALTPEPQMENGDEHSNAKLNLNPGPVITVFPKFPSTEGPTGKNVYPQHWSQGGGGFGSTTTYPNGTSSFSGLWGNPFLPWVKPLPAIPSGQNSGSIVTFTTGTSFYEDFHKRSGVEVPIYYLKTGKKYAITVHVASTICQTPFLTVYAKTIELLNGSSGSNGSGQSSHQTSIDMTGKEAQWVTETIEFTAQATQHRLFAWARTAMEGKYAYAHIFVDKNSIKQLN